MWFLGGCEFVILETEEGGMCFVSEISEGKKWMLFLSSFYSMRYKEEPYEYYSRIVQTGCDLQVKSNQPLGKGREYEISHKTLCWISHMYMYTFTSIFGNISDKNVCIQRKKWKVKM